MTDPKGTTERHDAAQAAGAAARLARPFRRVAAHERPAVKFRCAFYDSIVTANRARVTVTMTVTPDIIRAVADAALAHPRTVERRIVGLPVRGRVADRVDAELARRGLAPAAKASPSNPPPPSGRAA